MDAWTSQEVCDFLAEKGYAELGTEMLAQDVDGAILKATTVVELRSEFQIPTFAIAKRICLLVQEAMAEGGGALLLAQTLASMFLRCEDRNIVHT